MKPLVYEQTTFRGMRDSFDPSSSAPNLCYLLKNCYPLDRISGSSLVARPGYGRMGVAGGERGGTGATRQVQWLGQYTKLDGTESTIRICGGLLDTYNWTTDAWTNVALSGAGVALPASGIVYATVFANKLVVQPNDGTNKPFTFDGTTFVSLTNSPALWGPVTVYYAKLFGVMNTSRNTVVWSEENDPTLGYDTATYNNAWQLGQTDQEAVRCLVGTNEALYYWRERSLGAIRGAVTPDFSSDGTREGVSETVGTISPACVVVWDREIYFLDADARPHVLTFGGALTPLWDNVRETSWRTTKSYLTSAVGEAYPAANLVLLGFRYTDTSYPGRCYAIDVSTKQIAGQFDGYTFERMGTVKNATGTLYLVHGSPTGYVYKHGNPDEAVWTDTAVAGDGGTQAVTHKVIGPALGYDTATEKHWERLDIAVVLYTTLTNVAAGYTTPRGSQTTLNVASVAGGLSFWDGASVWDTATWSDEGMERHLSYGISAEGRWLRPEVTHSAAGERFNLSGWRLQAFPASQHPSAK